MVARPASQRACRCLTQALESSPTQREADEPAERRIWLDRDIKMAVS